MTDLEKEINEILRLQGYSKNETYTIEEFIIKFQDKLNWYWISWNENINFQSCTPKFKLLYGKYVR